MVGSVMPKAQVGVLVPDWDEREYEYGWRRDISPPRGDQPRIAIIDDSPTHLLQLRYILNQIEDVEIETFSCADATVLDLIVDRIDVVVLDNLMPKLSGLEFARKMRARPSVSTVPIVMLTSSHEVGVWRDAIEAGVTTFLTKPINPVRLRMTVERLLCPPC